MAKKTRDWLKKSREFWDLHRRKISRFTFLEKCKSRENLFVWLALQRGLWVPYVQSRLRREAVSEEETAAGVHAEDRLRDSREPEESERIPKVEHCSQSVYSGRKHAGQLEVQALSNAGRGWSLSPGSALLVSIFLFPTLPPRCRWIDPRVV